MTVPRYATAGQYCNAIVIELVMSLYRWGRPFVMGSIAHEQPKPLPIPVEGARQGQGAG